ncbi:MAG: HAMP domain-containing histidine kinase [Bacteroidales bacterium]|nr:HAMP domain-containing histidine kinase [Bacteroidales bacterium]
MKFLTKINRNYLILYFLILAGVTIVGYYILQAIILRGTKENLLSKEYLIRKQIIATGEIPNLYPIIEGQKTNDSSIIDPLFKEIEIWNELEKENEVFLEYSNEIKINDSYYLIKLRQSAFENEDLVIVLAFTLFILLLSAFLISFLVTKRMNKTVWADFEYNLQAIETFNLSENKNITLLNSNTEEFERLNRVVTNLTEKLKTDYLSLKQFTENASHEIQTPLTIALINLEEFLQLDLAPDTLKKIVISINAIKRLSTLNQSLTLLTKIENKQFISIKTLNINDIINYYIQEFAPLFETKKLKIDLIIEHDFTIKINKQLAELLITNLLSNAVNHNIPNGFIQILVKKNELKICNTGEVNSFTEENIFNRFVKGQSKSFGLGLAIVKKICETYDLEIHYFKNKLHCFTINSKS